MDRSTTVARDLHHAPSLPSGHATMCEAVRTAQSVAQEHSVREEAQRCPRSVGDRG